MRIEGWSVVDSLDQGGAETRLDLFPAAHVEMAERLSRVHGLHHRDGYPGLTQMVYELEQFRHH
jgi:hypothetical protein